MAEYVAFLRAINVGGHTVRMDRLRGLFEAMGLERVTTFIASGNVIFDSPERDVTALERRIESNLQRELGYEVGAYLRTPAELAAIAAHPPFTREEVAGAATLYVCFLPEVPPPAATEAVAALATATDELRLHDRELYWLCRTRLSDSEIKGPQLARALGLPSTMRNMNTVERILKKLADRK